MQGRVAAWKISQWTITSAAMRSWSCTNEEAGWRRPSVAGSVAKLCDLVWTRTAGSSTQSIIRIGAIREKPWTVRLLEKKCPLSLPELRSGMFGPHFIRRRASLRARRLVKMTKCDRAGGAFAQSYGETLLFRCSEIKAGEGNRTLVCSLGSCHSTIE